MLSAWNYHIFSNFYFTSVISLSAVSAPKEKSVPGTLLLIVDGMTQIGMQNAAYLDRFSINCRAAL